LGLPSNGLHTNGYSLARRLFFEQKGYSVDTRLADLGCTVGEALLAVHRSYLMPLIGLAGDPASGLTAMAHITGGGIPDNLPRVLPDGVQAVVDSAGWEEPALFRYIRREGKVPEEDMRRTFNLGVGMVLCVQKDRADAIATRLRAGGETPFPVGHLRPGPRGVIYV
jgi:phosphoribosylformylglycinamidine cyclo-ligase